MSGTGIVGREGKRLSDHGSIVLVIGSLHSGGAERILSEMANYWVRRGVDVTFATWTASQSVDFYPLDSKVNRVWLDDRPQAHSPISKISGTITRIGTLRALLIKIQPVAVLSFIATSNILTLIASRGLKMRVVVSERTNPGRSERISWVWKILRKALYQRADAVVAQTNGAGNWLDENCSVNTTIIPNPLRELPRIGVDREPLILAVGRLTSEKGFDALIRAFAEIHQDFPEWRVTIVGNGPEKRTLEIIRDGLGLTNSVEFREPTKNIEFWMSRAGLVVQPSRYEGFPNVVLEAMGMGAAVICTDCDWGPADLIKDYINGRLVPVDDLNALTAAMVELLSQPELRSCLGKEATTVRRLFQQRVVMKRWDECLLNESQN